MFKLSFKKIFKAWLSSLCGGIVLAIAPLTDAAVTGTVHWQILVGAFGVALLLAFSDAFKEIKKELDEDQG